MRKALGTGLISLLAITALALAGCSSGENAEHGQAAGGAVVKAVAVLHPTQGSAVHGVVTFTKVKKGVQLDAVVEGLTPGLHGFHIHEYGDCSDAAAALAGGHFNPTNMPHAGPTSAKRHGGDLGNLEANHAGVARLQWTDDMLTFEGPDSIIGRGVIVHAASDDFTTQPTGNSGGRVACGAIGITKP